MQYFQDFLFKQNYKELTDLNDLISKKIMVEENATTF